MTRLELENARQSSGLELGFRWTRLKAVAADLASRDGCSLSLFLVGPYWSLPSCKEWSSTHYLRPVRRRFCYRWWWLGFRSRSWNRRFVAAGRSAGGFADGDWSRIMPVLDVPAVMLRKLDFKPRCSTAEEELVSSGLLSHKCSPFHLILWL